jgi:hypothetical protein
LAYRIFPRLAAATLEINAAKLRPEGIPQLFARDLKEIDPRLNDDLLELYGRSEQVLNNHFGFFGRTQKFGAEINWEPAESPAWRRELHACDFAFDLALTYRISGEEHYARHLRYLIAHWISSNPPASGSGWHPPTVARRVRNWILSADLARADWEREWEFSALVRHSLALQSTFLLRHVSSLRSRTELQDASRALLLSHRFFGERSEFRAAARQLLLRERELPEGKAGVTSPGLGGWPTERLLRACVLMDWLLLDTRSLPALALNGAGPAQAGPDANWLQEEVGKSLASLKAVLMPSGSLPLLGPAARACADELSDLAALAAVMLPEPASSSGRGATRAPGAEQSGRAEPSPTSVWKAWAGQFGILPYMLLGEKGKGQFAARAEAPPEVISTFQDCGGIFRLNAPDSSSLLVSARFPSLPSDHCDFLSWELTTQGNRVVVDSGGYSPDEADYFPSAWAHNVLLVDGQASQPRASPMPAEHWKSGSGYAGLLLPDSGFRSRGLNHQRAWFCLEGGAWMVLDRLEGRPAVQSALRPERLLSKTPGRRWLPNVGALRAAGHARRAGPPCGPEQPPLSSLLAKEGKQGWSPSGGGPRCLSLLHFYPAFELLANDQRAAARSRACTVTVFPLGETPARLRVSRGSASESQLPGWYSPEFGIRFPASVLGVEWESIPLPWIGGVLIVPGEGAAFRMLGCSGHRVSFEWSGKQYALEF